MRSLKNACVLLLGLAACSENLGTGVMGPDGNEGPQGVTGPQGVEGEVGPIGPTGPTGSKGDQGPPGIPGASAIRWVDAVGTPVIGAAELSFNERGSPVYIDSAGIVWGLNTSRGTASVLLEDSSGLSQTLWYETPDCSGDAYFVSTGGGAVPPRLTFLHPSSPGVIRVRPDTAQEEDKTICSVVEYSGCQVLDPCSTHAVLQESLTVPSVPLEVPVLSYVPPFHPELP